MEIVPNFSNFEFNESVISFICPIQPKQEGWSLEEDKLFENALAFFDLNSSEIFQKIAEMLPGKTIEQVKFHFDELVHDLKLIEADSNNVKTSKKKHNVSASSRDMIIPAKKGARWTKEEHERFLVGLNKYGKGDWRSISRNCVLTKTPTQVASHAQKYFIRMAKSSCTTTTTKSPSKQEVKNTRAMSLTEQSPWVTSTHVSHQVDAGAAVVSNKRHKST